MCTCIQCVMVSKQLDGSDEAGLVKKKESVLPFQVCLEDSRIYCNLWRGWKNFSDIISLGVTYNFYFCGFQAWGFMQDLVEVWWATWIVCKHDASTPKLASLIEVLKCCECYQTIWCCLKSLLEGDWPRLSTATPSIHVPDHSRISTVTSSLFVLVLSRLLNKSVTIACTNGNQATVEDKTAGVPSHGIHCFMYCRPGMQFLT